MMAFGAKFFFLFLLAFVLSREILGIQIVLKQQSQDRPDVKSFKLASGQQLETPLFVKTNDTVTIEVRDFNKPFDHAYVIAKPTTKNHPTLRFPTTYKHMKSSASVQFDLKTDLFRGSNGPHDMYITFLRTSEKPFNLDIGKMNWELVFAPHDHIALRPLMEFEYTKDEHYSNPFLSWVFTMALLIPWFLLLPSWLHIGSKMEFRWFFSTLALMLCAFGFSGLAYLFWTKYNLLQVLPYLIALFVVSVPTTRVALRRVNQWKKA